MSADAHRAERTPVGALGCAALAVLVAALCGCSGGGPDSGDDPLVMRQDPAAMNVSINGASAAQRRELGWVLAGMGQTRITSVTLDNRRPWTKGVGMGLDARAGKEDRRAVWEQMLVAAVFRDRSAARRLPRVIWVSSPQMLGGASIEYRPPLRVRLFRPGDAERVAQGIRRAARVSGAHLDELILLQPEGVAPIVRLRVDDPVRFFRERYDRFLSVLNDDRIHYEGEYLELVDGAGRPVWRSYGVARLHWGGSWQRRDLADCWRAWTEPADDRSRDSCDIDH
jgi:hypothetical protein